VTADDQSPADFVWGSEVERSAVGGHPCLVYRHRRRAVGEFLLDARRFADREYLVQGDRRITYGEHEGAVGRIAAWLRDVGVRPGDRVLLLGANRPEWIVAFFATVSVGAVAVPGNAWWSPAEVAHAVVTTEPRLVLVDGRRRKLLPDHLGGDVFDFDELRALIDGPGPPGALELTPPVAEDDPAVILFTSGTTGAPKGATLSHRAVIANPHNLLALTRRFPADVPLDAPPAVSLLTMPLFHIGGLQTVLVTLLTGGTLLFLDGRFDAGEVLRLIEVEGVTRWGCVPTMVARVLEHPDVAARDTSSLRSITMGGSPVAPELVARARAALPQARRGVGTAYGLSESGGVLTTGTGDDYAARPHSVGRALPVVELRIHQPGAGAAGEILARSPTVMSGYWGLPEDRTVDGEGWLHTGDVGRIDEDGHLYVLDRSKDVIIRGGENLASSHVEDRLLAHPDVAQVAVIGLPHPDLGEEVAAVVVVRAGTQPSVSDLHAHAAGGLAHFEVPTAWWIRSEPLPVNSVGKVLKRELRHSWPESDQAKEGK
jgi:long-chain acyl-CoA synthetase